MAKEIKSCLHTILRKDDNWKFQLLHQWPTLFGNLQTTIQLIKIQDDTLVLGIADSCWMQELYMLSNILIKTINKTLDQPRIKKLHFKTIRPCKKIEYKSYHPIKKEFKVINLSATEQYALKKIDDHELSSALNEFLIRCYQEKT